MRFDYDEHAEIRMNERNITRKQLQEAFHKATEEKIHKRRFRRVLDVDGLDVEVIYERHRDVYYIATAWVQ